MNRHTSTTARLVRTLALSGVFGLAAFASPAHAGPVEFLEPTYTVDYRCEEDGAYLDVEVIDESPYRYDVYVDDVLVIDFESDPDGDPWSFGPYADGSDVFVEIFWYTSDGDETAELLSDGTVFFECGPSDTGVPTTEPADTTATTQLAGSGGTLPSTGGSDTTLVVTALALLAAGGALLAARRPRQA